jgi:hypothetical protein
MARTAKPVPLQEHIASTYFSLRKGLVLLAIVLPLVLPVAARLLGIPYQRSLSAYYHAVGPNGESVRDAFVGMLLIVGALMWLYRGYSRPENRLLNLAGVLVALVAVVPMRWPEATHAAVNDVGTAAVEAASLHGTFAVGFFLCIAAVCLYCSGKTLALIPDLAKRARYRNAYRLLGAVMIVAPILAYVFSFTINGDYAIIVVETAGVLAFGAYWLVKTGELSLSHAEQDALEGTLDLPIETASSPDEPPAAGHELERAA